MLFQFPRNPINMPPFSAGSSPHLFCDSGRELYTRYVTRTKLYGPRQANLVFIAHASSEGSGEPAHSRNLARISAARSYKQWVKRNLQTERPLNDWACAVKICHDGMLEDINSLDAALIVLLLIICNLDQICCVFCFTFIKVFEK